MPTSECRLHAPLAVTDTRLSAQPASRRPAGGRHSHRLTPRPAGASPGELTRRRDHNPTRKGNGFGPSWPTPGTGCDPLPFRCGPPEIPRYLPPCPGGLGAAGGGRRSDVSSVPPRDRRPMGFGPHPRRRGHPAPGLPALQPRRRRPVEREKASPVGRRLALKLRFLCQLAARDSSSPVFPPNNPQTRRCNLNADKDGRYRRRRP
jgi:hypothetical protein